MTTLSEQIRTKLSSSWSLAKPPKFDGGDGWKNEINILSSSLFVITGEASMEMGDLVGQMHKTTTNVQLLIHTLTQSKVKEIRDEALKILAEDGITDYLFIMGDYTEEQKIYKKNGTQRWVSLVNLTAVTYELIY